MLGLLLLTLVWPQEQAPIPPTPFDRVIELELTADDEALIEGRGPTAIVEYEVEFSGTLHVWTRSQLDLFLRAEDAGEMQLLAEDDHSGGGKTPYLELQVEPGQFLALFVAGRSAGPFELHLAASIESDLTRAAAAAGREARAKAARLIGEGYRSGAREVLAAAVGRLGSTVGVAHSQVIAIELLSLALFANAELNAIRMCADSRGRALRHRERTLPEDHPGLLSTRHNLANSMHAMGDIASARALRESVLAARQRTLPEDHPDLLRARHNLANSMDAMGDIGGARAFRESVLAARQRSLPKDHPDILSTRESLAISLHRLGDTVGARALLESVLAAYECTLPEDHPSLLRTQANLAVSLEAMEDFAGALSLKEGVLAAYERTLPENHADLLRAQVALANSMATLGDIASARALRESALTGYERTLPKDHPDILLARGSLALSMKAVGELAGAHALFKSVLAAWERTRPEDHPRLLGARSTLALSMSTIGDTAGVRTLLPALSSGMCKRVLAAVALAPREARQTVASEANRLFCVLFLSEASTSMPGADDRDLSGLQSAAFELLETMRLVAGEAARSLARFDTDPELAPILQEAAAVRAALNDLAAGSARDGVTGKSFAAELTRLSLQRDQLERVASRKLAERGVVARAVEAQALAAALGPGDMAVGFRRIASRWVQQESTRLLEPGEERLLAHVLKPDGTLARLDLGPAAELENLAGAWRTALGVPLLRGLALGREEGDPEAWRGARLRARILDPVLALAGEDVRRLFVCADDLVYLVPLDALPLDVEGKERIGDRLQIVNEVSFARLLAGSAPASGEPSLLALGGVDYDSEGSAPEGLNAASAPIDETESSVIDSSEARGTGGSLPERFQKLLQTRYEAEAVAGLFEEAFEREPTLLTRKETTKAALFAAAPGKRNVHLATHGWFAPESVRSTEDAPPTASSFVRMGLGERTAGLAPMTLCGLALAGANRGRDSLGRVTGILTAEELCSLDLSACDLAVLSACETNVGIRRAGQGIQSLQAALYAAGARTSITSLWKVDDAATRRLFEVFYTGLWDEELPKAEALWRAKRALRDEGHPPAHWAGWVLTGDPD